MLTALKTLIRSTPIYDILTKMRRTIHYRRWLKAGCPLPPSGFVKHHILREYARRFPADVFVETGTYRGDTLSALKNEFSELHSIEVVPEFAERARRIFKSNKHITIHEGDSAVLMKDVLAQIKGKSAIFWLDGHFFGGLPRIVEDESPIVAELEAIAASDVEPVALLIDDVREFDGTRGYPTIEVLKGQITRLFGEDRQFFMLDDIIRWHA
jgi:hypothetical protein